MVGLMTGLVIIWFVLMAICIVCLISIAYVYSDDVIVLIAGMSAGFMLAALIFLIMEFFDLI